jgi:sugar phosphate permease
MVKWDNRELKIPSPHPKKIFYGWYLVAASWLMAFLVSATSVGIFFKPLLDEFGWSRAQLSLVSSITMLVFAALSPFLGRLIDHFGPRLMLLASAAAQALSSLTYGFAHSLPVVYLGRFLYELKPTHGTQILINHWFIKKRGRALGIISSGIPLGQLVLSPVSQYLITTWGWRNTFYFWAAVTAALVLPLLFFIRDKPIQKGLLPDGVPLPPKDLIFPLPTASLPTFTAGFKINQALRRRSFWLLAATHIICGVTCGLMGTHIVIMATDLGYSAVIGASFLSVQGGVSLLGVLFTGVLSDRLLRHKVLSLTHLIRSLGLWVLVVPLSLGLNNLVLIYAAMALFGFGWFTTSPLVGGLAADLFGNLRMGTLLGIFLSGHMIGMAIGAYTGGLSFQLTGSYQIILFITAALELLACLFAFAIRPPAKP